MLQKQLEHCWFDLAKVYGPQFVKDGLAFMYTESSDIVQAARVMWTEMGDQLSR